MNNIELSQRVQPLITALREGLDYETYNELMDDVSRSDGFEKLTGKSKNIIIGFEAKVKQQNPL